MESTCRVWGKPAGAHLVCLSRRGCMVWFAASQRDGRHFEDFGVR